MLLTIGLLAVVGCDGDECIFDPVPATPQGVYSVTGNEMVYLFWYGPYERDIVEYIIWRSSDPDTGYTERGRQAARPNPNLDTLFIYGWIDEGQDVVNGETYYYAVSSVDRAGQESDLSAEDVFDTPRPDGQVVLFDVAAEPNLAGYLFAAFTIVDTSRADVYLTREGNVFSLNVGNDTTDIQDMGFTETFDDIGWAPQDGWSELGKVEIIEGHTYVIWTDDLHFAKMRAEKINFDDDWVMFLWAYQIDDNNPELVPRPDNFEKPFQGAQHLHDDTNSNSLK